MENTLVHGTDNGSSNLLGGAMKLKSKRPDIAWIWSKWTFGFWHDKKNYTFFGIDIGPLEIVWRYNGYRP